MLQICSVRGQRPEQVRAHRAGAAALGAEHQEGRASLRVRWASFAKRGFRFAASSVARARRSAIGTFIGSSDGVYAGKDATVAGW